MHESGGSPSPMRSSLAPRASLGFECAYLEVRLGWGAEERARPQRVALAVSIEFAEPPLACGSDDLTDTVCYADLIDRARQLAASRDFRLIEHLAALLATELRRPLPAGARMRIRVTKLNPPVEDLDGGVHFTLES